MPVDRIKYTYTPEEWAKIEKLMQECEQIEKAPVPVSNSLTPDDRLFLAYLAAKIRDTMHVCNDNNCSVELEFRSQAKYLCENYKDKEQEK